MSTTKEKFVNACMDIVNAKPKYELGASNTKKCDCIGMIKYGLRKNNVTLTTTGTNWTIRHQVKEVKRITSASMLKYGDILFKSKAPGESGYNLPAKYRKGNSEYNGDLNDYCHVGVVKSVNPLKIIHMTGPTAKTDSAIGKWKWATNLKDQYISDGTPSPTPTPTPDPSPEPGPYIDEAIVIADSGKWVKMRKEPSTSCGIYDEVPVGAKVKVISHGYDWTRITYDGRKGWYMMTKFLDTIGDGKGKY